MTNNANNPIKIIQYIANNVKRLKAVRIRPDQGKNIIVLSGKNRQGKSSVIESIWWALSGKDVIPSQPIRKGEKEAIVALDMGEFTVERRFTESGNSYLEVKNKDGFKASSPQAFLSARIGSFAQNPLEFIRLSPADQVKALQSMIDIKLDVEELGRISGLPTKGIRTDDPIMVLDSAYKHIFEERTKVNNEVKRLEGATKTAKAQIPPERENTLAVSVSELFEKRKALETQAEANSAQHKILTDLGTVHVERMDEMATLESRIEETKKLLEELESNRKTLTLRIDASTAAYEQQTEVVAALIDPSFEEVDTEIAAADETNRIAESVRQFRERSAELETEKNKANDLTVKLTAIKDYKGRLILEAGLPVEGLGLDAGEVTYNGVPLSQASTAEQIETSCAICAASHPEIRVLTIDIGFSELDSESKAVLSAWAEKMNTQIWVTKVTDEASEGGFWIEDGELKAIDGNPVQAEAEMEVAQ